MKRTRTFNLFAAFLALALVVAACGGDTAEETTTTASEPGTTADSGGEETTTTESSEPMEPVRGIDDDGTVHLGAWIAQSGPLAVVSNIADAIQLRFELANEAGGVNGYTFDYTALDDQANPSQTVNAVRELWETEEVFALVHPYGSGGLSAVQDYLIENEIPTLFPFADSRILFSGEAPENVYGFVPFYADAIELMMRHVNEAEGVETVAVLHTNDPLGEAGPEGAEAAAEELGMEVIETVGYDSTETNFAPLGRRLAESDADAILIWSFSGSTQVLQAALESGYEGIILLHDGYRGGFFFSQLLDLPFELDGRTFTNIWWVPTDEPEAADFVSAFTEAYPEGDQNLAQSGWAAAELFLTAVEQTTADGEPLTWEALKATLDSWDQENIGMTVGITYTDGIRTGATQGKVRQLESGSWVDAIDWTTYSRYE